MAKTLIKMSEEDIEFFVEELVVYSSHLGEPQKDREIMKELFEREIHPVLSQEEIDYAKRNPQRYFYELTHCNPEEQIAINRLRNRDISP